MRNAKNHILVIRFSSLGDVALVVPVLTALQKFHPNCKLTVLTKPAFAPLFSHLEGVTVKSIELNKKFKGLVGLWKLSQYIKSLKIDHVADLHSVLRTKILRVFLPGMKWAILDKGRYNKKQLISGKIFQPLKHTSERYADVFRSLGYDLSLENLDLINPKSPTNRLLSFLKPLNKPIVGVAPFAAHRSKMYPLEKMKRIIDHISLEYTVLLFGAGHSERQILEELAASKSNIVSLAGQFSMEEELTIMAQLKVMLAMDSANAHMAAMVGTRVVTLWGVTHPYAGFKPFNQPLKNCLVSDRDKFPKIPTSIYGNRYPKGYEFAMETIAENDVIKAIKLA